MYVQSIIGGGGVEIEKTDLISRYCCKVGHGQMQFVLFV